MNILNIMKMPEFISWCREWENNKQCHPQMVDWFLDFGTKECVFYANVCRWCLCKRTYYASTANRIINNEDWNIQFSGFVRPIKIRKAKYYSWYSRKEDEMEIQKFWDCNDIYESIVPKFPGEVIEKAEDIYDWQNHAIQTYHLLSRCLMVSIDNGGGSGQSVQFFSLFENAIAWLLGTWYESKVEPRSLLSEEEQSLIIW